MVKDSLLNKLPKWYEDLDPEKHYLVMSNDFDSYLSCKVLMELFQLQIGGFYEFESGLWLNKERIENKQPIYVDLSITKGMTFDNHLTFIDNPLAINPNVLTTDYFRKYNGSTLALVCALYDYDISNDKRLMTILCVDGWYYGYYNRDGKYRDINIRWYETLGMCEKLLPILQKHDKNHFLDYIEKYKLNSRIYMQNNTLQCGVNIPLPECRFDLVTPVRKYTTRKSKAQEEYLKDPDDIMVSVETFKDYYVINRKEY